MVGLRNLFLTQTVDASGNAASSVVCTEGITNLDIYAKNAGTSTNCTITIKGSSTSAKTLVRTLAVFTFGASQGEGVSIEENSIPRYTWAEVVNGDATKAASVSVQLDSQDWNI